MTSGCRGTKPSPSPNIGHFCNATCFWPLWWSAVGCTETALVPPSPSAQLCFSSLLSPMWSFPSTCGLLISCRDGSWVPTLQALRMWWRPLCGQICQCSHFCLLNTQKVFPHSWDYVNIKYLDWENEHTWNIRGEKCRGKNRTSFCSPKAQMGGTVALTEQSILVWLVWNITLIIE